MYNIERQDYFTDTMTLSKNGVVELEIPVEIHVDDVVSGLGAAEREIFAAQETLKRAYNAGNGISITEAAEGLKTAYKRLIYCLFGDDAAGQIEQYYHGRWYEVMRDLHPYITGVIIPVVQREQTDIADEYLSAVK